MLTVGRVTFAPRSDHITITDVKPASRTNGVIGIEQLLRAIGIQRVSRDSSWPLPCLDVNTLHKRNAERIRARKKGL